MLIIGCDAENFDTPNTPAAAVQTRWPRGEFCLRLTLHLIFFGGSLWRVCLKSLPH
jgi:hypothetical protein